MFLSTSSRHFFLTTKHFSLAPSFTQAFAMAAAAAMWLGESVDEHDDNVEHDHEQEHEHEREDADEDDMEEEGDDEVGESPSSDSGAESDDHLFARE